MSTGGAEPDVDAYREHAGRLADAVDAALPGWVRRCVEGRLAVAGVAFDDAARALTDEAADRCLREVGPAVRSLVDTDPDDQRLTPLTMLRAAVEYPTAVLERLGVPPVDRDDFDVHAFPRDHYGLVPASFADVDPSLHEPGLAWGAAKAHVHLARRRGRGG